MSFFFLKRQLTECK